MAETYFLREKNKLNNNTETRFFKLSPMQSTGINALANFLSNLAGPAIAVVMTPFYLKVIGLEGLGLIGLMAVLNSVLGLFISGISKAYQRDISIANANAQEELTSLLRGGMILFASIAILLALTVLIFGRQQIQGIAKDSQFTIVTLDRCLYAISAIIAISIISGSIAAALIALKDQVFLAQISLLTSVSGAIFSWYVLSLYPRVDVFYFCQLGFIMLSLIILVFRISSIQRRNAKKVPQSSMRQVWKGKLQKDGKLLGILIIQEGMGMIITQIDRIIITTLFPLSALGAYNLGANPARMTGIITAPINIAVFPEICGLAATNNSREVVGEYIARVTFLMSLIFSSAVLILASAGQDLLNLWLGIDKVPEETAIVLTLLSAGHLLHAIAGPYYNLTVAYGRIAYGIPKNIIALALLPPLGYLATVNFGVTGAATIWLTYGVICVVVCMWIVFKRHADFRSGLRWHFASLSCISLGFIVVLLLVSLPFHGWFRLLISSAASVILVIGYITYYFGWSIRSWLSSINVQQLPHETTHHDINNH